MGPHANHSIQAEFIPHMLPKKASRHHLEGKGGSARAMSAWWPTATHIDVSRLSVRKRNTIDHGAIIFKCAGLADILWHALSQMEQIWCPE